MTIHRYSVEFRIFSETLDPASITRKLGLQPSRAWTEGSRPIRGRIDLGMWGYNGSDRGDIDWESLEEGLNFVLDKLWPYREAIIGYKSTAELVWWCGHFQTGFDGGPRLSPPTLRRLGEFGADLFIDNYFSMPDEQHPAK